MDVTKNQHNFTVEEITLVSNTLAKFPTNSQVAVARIVDANADFCGARKADKKVEMIDNRYAVFDIGSIAKTFTTAMLANQVVEQTLSFDDEISQILGFLLKTNAKITLKQLANHTSGLPRIPSDLFWELLFKDKSNPYANYDQSRLQNYLQHKLKLNKQGKFAYSNLGVGLLSHVLTQINNQSYETLLQRIICQPLGLQQITTLRTNVSKHLVQGQNTKGNPVPYWDLGALLGAGGIYSSVLDLAKYIIHNINDVSPEFALQRRETAKVNKQIAIGLGWFIAQKEKGSKTLYFHDGGTSGFTSIAFMNVESRCGIVILSNISGNHILKAGHLPKLAQHLYKNIGIDEPS
jgi:CubicO group peptidase (beta-lactamase class C family)